MAAYTDNRITPSTSIEDEEKEKGNRCFKVGKYREAMLHYSNAIDQNNQNHILFSNRAQAYLNLKKPREAESDCNEALALNPKFVKAYHRRALAKRALGKFNEAIADWETVLKLEPGNRDSIEKIRETRKLLHPGQVGDGSSAVKPTFTCPETNPSNAFDFYDNWRQIEQEETRWKYLQQIGSENLASLFSSGIEPALFSELLKTLYTFRELKFIFSLLDQLRNIQRFTAMILFLEPHEITTLRSIFAEMRLSSYIEDKNLVDQLENIYCT